MEEQLRNWRSELQNQLAAVIGQIEQLQRNASETRAKISAIDQLTGANSNSDTGAPSQTAQVEDRIFTPVATYWRPILQTLVELGGRGTRENVIDSVGKKMSAILTSADYGTLSKSNVIRWRNRVAWQASNMRALGLMKTGGARGIWEITDAGREWLADPKN